MKLARYRSLTFVSVVLSTFLVTACASDADREVAASCAASGGKWVSGSRECEIGEKEWCDARSGAFNACASPCRNTPRSICATVCVPVCKLPGR